MSSEEVLLPIPNLALQQARFILSEPKCQHLHEKNRAALIEGVEKDGMSNSSRTPVRWLLIVYGNVEMAPYLSMLLSDFTLSSVLHPPIPDTLLPSLKSKNEEELKRLKEKFEDAEANLGETELSDALRAKATYLARIGEKDEAVKAHEVALEKTPGLGSKIDLRLSLIRIGFFFGDNDLIVKEIANAKASVIARCVDQP